MAAVSRDQPSAADIRSGLSCGRARCKCLFNRNTHCPGPRHSNGDRDPSLTVDDNPRGGLPLVNCKAGCPQEVVLELLRGRNLWPRPSRPAAQQPSRPAVAHRCGPVVATYQYERADGSVGSRKVRKACKCFVWEHPEGSGWKLGRGGPATIYRLPEVLAADPSAIVWRANGEKAVDRLVSLGLVATCGPNGEGKWSDVDSQPLTGRRVVILEDNDQAGRDDTVVSLTSLERYAAQVAVLRLDGLPEHGDVVDLLDADEPIERIVERGEHVLAGPAVVGVGVRAALDSDGDAESSDRVLLAFPTDVLSPTMRGLITAGSAALMVPPELIGVPHLVAAGAAIGNAYEIEIKGGFREGTNLYAVVVAEPGSGKTPAQQLAMDPLHAVQDMLTATFERESAQYAQSVADWESADKSERGERPKVPVYRQIITTDVTPESLAVLQQDNKTTLVEKDEFLSFVLGMDQYKSGGRGAERQHYLSMWSRKTIHISRKGEPVPIRVRRPCVSVVGGIQPDVLPSLIGRDHSSDGFLDRPLWSYPAIGDQFWSDAEVDEQVTTDASYLFCQLYDLKQEQSDDGKQRPHVVSLSSDAYRVWKQWFNTNKRESIDPTLGLGLKNTWAKMPNQLARLALILHVTWALDTEEYLRSDVSAQTLERAIELVEYFKDHVKAVMPSVRAGRSKLAERALRALDDGPITLREAHRALGWRLKLDRVRATYEELAEDGQVTITRSTGMKGGRPTIILDLAHRDASGRPRRPIRLDDHRR